MARKLRIDYPGAIYHMMNRGDRREAIFHVGWTEGDLAARRKADRGKLKLAVNLRAETTMTLKRIAARLQMGTGASLSNLLSVQRRKES